nr:CocE/NonD family hydrolase [Bacilli bacterium]
MRVVFERDVPCTLRDGIILRANVYRPDEGGPYPVILTRLPYGKDGSAYSVLDPIRLAEAGYIVVIQDVRGCFASDGEFQGFPQEFNDGYDAVEWAAHLPNANDTVGMYGVSYYGYTQWAAAAMKPPSLRVVAPTIALDDGWLGATFRHGAIEWGMTASWFSGMAVANLFKVKEQFEDFPARFGRLVYDNDRLSHEGYFDLPLDQFGALRRAGVLPDFFEQITRTRYDDTWRAMSIKPHYDQMDVAAFLTGGWYDVFLQSTLDAYLALQQNGKEARLLIGPWSHINFTGAVGDVEFGAAADIGFLNFEMDRTMLHRRFFDHTLKQPDPGLEQEPPVRLFVMGSNTWRYASAWPLPETTYTPYYLHSESTLSTTTPTLEPADHYTYDPLNPVITTGGNLLMTPSYRPGPLDQATVEARDDVLVYTSAPLEEALTVIGPVKARLFVSTTAQDTDFVVRLTDVDPSGRSLNLADGIVRMRYRDSLEHPSLLEPNHIYAIEVDLWATANVFLPGHCIRVQITSSNFPRWSRNLNTGESNESTAETIVATQTILHDEKHPSHLLLPVIPLA